MLRQVGEQSAALSGLLDRLRETASLPLTDAIALAPALYTSEELLRREVETLFRHGWICSGRQDELKEPGDYLTFEIAGQPVVSILQDNGAVRTFSNVCLHRSAQLLEGRGNCKRIVCPYHAWTYDRTGRLLAAPFMEKARGFNPKDHHLTQIRTEIWEGWIYVTLDEQLPSVCEQLQGLRARLEMFDMAKYVQVFRKDEVWKTNWKNLAENFMESYHLFRLHAETVEPDMPTRTTVCVDGEAAYCLHYFWGTPESAISRAHSSKSHLQGDDQRKYYDACVFPSHLLAGGHNFVFWLSIYPLSVSEVHVRWGISVAPEYLNDIEDKEAHAKELEALFDRVNLEDRTVLEAMQRAQGGPLSKSGRLSHLEQPLWEFHKFLARSLTN